MELTEKQRKEVLRQHFSEMGKKGAETNKKKGSDFFRWVRMKGVEKQKMAKADKKFGKKK
jgi:hypothetical protein